MADQDSRPRGRADYEALLAEHASNRMSLPAFAETKETNSSTQYSWIQRLRPQLRGAEVPEPPWPAPVYVPGDELPSADTLTLSVLVARPSGTASSQPGS